MKAAWRQGEPVGLWRQLYTLIDTKADAYMEAIANALASKRCFVAFTLWSFSPAVISPPEGYLAWNQFISQAMIQLIALSVLAYVAKKEGLASRNVSMDTYNGVMDELRLAQEERANVKALMQAQHLTYIELHETLTTNINVSQTGCK